MNSRNKLLLLYPIYLIVVSCFILEIILRIFCSKQDDRIILFNKPWLILPPISTPSITVVESDENCYMCYDDSLGWKIKQNSNSPPLYYTNSQGFRVTESQYKNGYKYNDIAIITIGGSQTEGVDVKCENSWPYIIEELSGYNVGNIGTRGYGLDQAILSYKNTNIESQMVILGIIPDSFERSTRIVMSGLYASGYLSKPMFHFTQTNSYDIINIPAKRGEKLETEYINGLKSDLFKYEKAFHPYLFQEHLLDFFYSFRFFKMIPLQLMTAQKKRIYISNTDDFIYIKNILNVFKSITIEKDDVPIILLMGPDKNTNDGYPNSWEKTKSLLDSIKISYVDITNELHDEVIACKDSIYFKIGGHNTPKANNIIANELINSQAFIRFINNQESK